MLRVSSWSSGRALTISRVMRTQLSSLVRLRLPICLSGPAHDGRRQLLAVLLELQGLEELHLDRVRGAGLIQYDDTALGLWRCSIL